MASSVNLDFAIKNSCRWLLNQQDKKTGGWAGNLGNPLSTLNTAEAIIGLCDKGYDANHTEIRRGLQYLLNNRCTGGEHRGAWCREPPRGGASVIAFPDIIRTSFALQALIKVGWGDNAAVAEGLLWLKGIQNDDKGWSYRKSCPSEILPTCFALLPLIASHPWEKENISYITEGIAFLLSFFRGGPFYTDSDHKDRLEGIHTIFTIIVLQSARNVNILGYVEYESEAINWILNNQDAALKIVEETITIDEKGGPANYGYLFTPDAFLIQILLNSTKDKHKHSGLINKAMTSLLDRMNQEQGGFYSPRLFTWATAKAISAMKISQAIFPEFPPETSISPLPPPSKNVDSATKTGLYILMFLTFLLIATVILTLYQVFSIAQMAVVIFLSLIALGGFGLMGEQSLIKALKYLLNVFHK